VKKDNSATTVKAAPVSGARKQQAFAFKHLFEEFMAAFPAGRTFVICSLMLTSAPFATQAQGNYGVEGGEYNISGVLPGEQMFPRAAIKPGGGYIVWQDNFTDGSGAGISARKLDSSLSSPFSPFRVNHVGNDDQEQPAVSLLNGGGAVFVWEGGKQGYQHIYARFLSPAGTWITGVGNNGEVMVNTPTNRYQLEPAVATLANGNVVVTWSSFNQVSANSLRDVYLQLLTPEGVKIGGENRVNQFSAFNQRSAAITPLNDGRFIVVWISEQQRFSPNPIPDNVNGVSPTQIGFASIDVYGRIYSAAGVPEGGEFLINSGMSACANPSVASSADGGFAVVWMERDTQTTGMGWDVFFRPFSGNALGGTTQRVNSNLSGDQLAPKISSMGTDYLVIWTSMGQDSSREGVYGQYLRGDGAPLYAEFKVNNTFINQQMQPAIASDGVERFLTVWTSFIGGAGSFDLYAQRFVNTNAPLAAPGAPIVSVLSSNTLSVSWPAVAGLEVVNYEVYADGALSATAIVTNTYWNATGLAPSSSHSYRLSYLLADGRRSPLSGATTNTTYSAGATWGGIPQEWMTGHFGNDIFSWPSPYVDSDGDGASNRDEFLAGTDPKNAASVLKQNIRMTIQGPFLDWNTTPGLMYQVQYATSAAGGWANLGGPRFAAGAMDTLYVGGIGGQFFRIARLR
jgi:hypothetical protein